jgi:hypothetical protein
VQNDDSSLARKEDEARHLVRAADATERVEAAPLGDRPLGVVRPEGVGGVLHHRGPDRARRDAVAADVVAGVVEGDGRRQADDAALRGGVGGDGLLRREGLDRGGVDDRAAPASAHLRDRVLAGEERPLQVGVDLEVPVLDRQLLDRAVADHAGAVVEDVDAPERVHRPLDQRAHLLRLADIAADRRQPGLPSPRPGGSPPRRPPR